MDPWAISRIRLRSSPQPAVRSRLTSSTDFAGGLDLLQQPLQKFSVRARVGCSLVRRRAHGHALDHDRTVETGPLEPCKHAAEVHFAGTELRHHFALRCRTILRAESGDVLDHRL